VEDDGLLVLAVLGAAAAAAGSWRWWSSGEFGAGRRVPILPLSSPFFLPFLVSVSVTSSLSGFFFGPLSFQLTYIRVRITAVNS
jgi:hypothetical protein